MKARSYLKVRFIKCPIRTSLGVLGKKRTILIMRYQLFQD
jgi:DNA-binding HxlR family transcriptional regulator